MIALFQLFGLETVGDMSMFQKKMLGDILREMGFITKEQLDEALVEQRKIFTEKTLPMRLAPDRLIAEAREASNTYQIPLLGQILIGKGFTTVEELQEALREQEKIRDAYKSLDKESLITALENSYLIHSSLNPAEILSRIMIQINRVTRSVASTLMLLDEKTNELVFSVPTGPKVKQLTDIRLPPGEGIAGWVAEHGEALIIPDVKDDPRFYGGIDSEFGFETKSILCVPLKAGAKLIGVVEVINRKDGTSFTEKDLLLLSIFASQAALAIEKARLYRELQDRVQEVLANTAELKKSKQDLQRSERKYRNIFNSSLVSLWEEDISELRAAIEALKEKGIRDFRRYFDEHPESVAEAVKLIKILDVNEATLRLYGIKKKEELPGALEKVFTAEGMSVLQEELIAIAEGKRHIEGETVGRTSRGKKLNLLIKITIPENEQIRHPMLVGIMDITERKRAEEALREYSERLEEMVEERSRELRDAQERLVRSERLAVLGQLAGGVGHELRNPLGVISNAVYYLRSAYPDSNETTRECLNMISAEVRNAEKTISDLLGLSRTRAAGRESIGLSDLVSRVLEKYPAEENIRVEIDIPAGIPAVFVDPLQIEQVLQNLIANGCQAMHEGGELFIRAIAVAERVDVSISDTGCGIPRENLGKIFEPLFTTKARGMGLGLAVSKNLVELNGCRLEVESEEGKGSTFTVSLPTEA